MEHVVWRERPQLRTPTLIAAFTGWNDAGDAASLAVQQMVATWKATKVAEIDAEEYFEFQATRPHVRLVDGVTREIVWPPNEFYAASTPGGDVLLLAGTEPQLRWRGFCREIIEVAQTFGSPMVVTLGALLADVPHSRPVNIMGTATDQRLIDRFNLQRSRYEGPTGIVGVLQDACTTAGMSAVSLWAAVPAYAPGTPSPKAALGLLRRSVDLIGTPADTRSLEHASGDYEREVASNVADDDELAGYVRRLEAAYDEDADDDADDGAPSLPDTPDAGSLMDEVERFLRDQGQ
jgi:proteasome assembly chaperone (PAC2) family protein